MLRVNTVYRILMANGILFLQRQITKQEIIMVYDKPYIERNRPSPILVCQDLVILAVVYCFYPAKK